MWHQKEAWKWKFTLTFSLLPGRGREGLGIVLYTPWMYQTPLGCINKPAKDLRCFLQKYFMPLTISTTSSIFDVWQDFDYTNKTSHRKTSNLFFSVKLIFQEEYENLFVKNYDYCENFLREHYQGLWATPLRETPLWKEDKPKRSFWADF